MDPALVELRRAARLGEHGLPMRCELCGREGGELHTHHAGGRTYGGLPVRVCVACHKELSRRQAPYAHLLDLADPPDWVVAMVWRLDVTALIEVLAERGRLRDVLLDRLARADRERVRDAVAPRLRDPAIRTLLRRHRTRGAGDER
jgi:hypothetical protein